MDTFEVKGATEEHLNQLRNQGFWHIRDLGDDYYMGAGYHVVRCAWEDIDTLTDLLDEMGLKYKLL